MKNSTYQDRVAAIVERDNLTQSNLDALSRLTDERLRWAETPADEERAFKIDENVQDWLIKAALRRHRKAVAAAHAPLNNAFGLALKRVKARAAK